MIIIENTLISENVVERKFVCDLSKCKGECCVAGDAGAPLEEDEINILEEFYPLFKQYIPADGIEAIEKQGLFVVDDDNEFLTPLVEGKHCAYVYFEDDIAKCAIERAYNEGKINFRKPISCHLYPVRITSFNSIDALNYHEWEICKPACMLGEKLNVPAYKFLKEPLTRKYGSDWFKKLDEYIY